MKLALLVAAVLLVAGCVLGDDRPSDSRDFVEKERQSTYHAHYEVKALDSDADETYRLDVYLKDDLKREDAIYANGAFSYFNIDPQYGLNCVWRGEFDLSLEDPLQEAAAECGKLPPTPSYDEGIYSLSGGLTLPNSVEGWTQVEGRTVLEYATQCFTKEVEPEIFDERCYTEDGWLAFQSRTTPEGGSTKVAVLLTEDVPSDSFTIPDDVDDRTGQPF